MDLPGSPCTSPSRSKSLPRVHLKDYTKILLAHPITIVAPTKKALWPPSDIFWQPEAIPDSHRLKRFLAQRSFRMVCPTGEGDRASGVVLRFASGRGIRSRGRGMHQSCNADPLDGQHYPVLRRAREGIAIRCAGHER